MDVSNERRQAAIDYAKVLVQDQLSLEAKPHERLWQIARKLDVSRIEPGATRSQGFVKRLDDGTFGIFYSNQFSVSRRRYTVAHELAHLVLERFVPHIRPELTVARGGTRNSRIERVVDRIAAELLMPEHLVLKTLINESKRELEQSNCICKYRVLCSLKRQFGVSESAMAFRLVEVPQLLAVILRVMCSDAPRRLRDQRHILQTSQHSSSLTLVADIQTLASTIPSRQVQFARDSSPMVHSLMIDSHLPRRLLNCAGWMRVIPIRPKYHEYWILGWTWNAMVVPNYDDSLIVESDE